MARYARCCGLVLSLWVFLAAPAAAQGVGVRAGASVDPDQFYFGGHIETKPLVEQLHFRPNVEIGLGDDVTLVAVNLEFVYMIPSTTDWKLYAGGGPALNFIDVDAANSSEGGFNIVFGASHERGLFGEVKVGFLDSPDFKIGVGYTFRWR
jgi:hypothetical protein